RDRRSSSVGGRGHLRRGGRGSYPVIRPRRRVLASPRIRGTELPQMRRTAPHCKGRLRRPDLCGRRSLQEAPDLATVSRGKGLSSMCQSHNLVWCGDHVRGLNLGPCPTPSPARGMEQARWGQFVDSIKALCYYVVGNSGLGGEAYELATGAYVPNQRRKSLGQNGQGEVRHERKPASQGPDHA